MPQDRGGKNRKVCDWLMQAPFFEGFSCQPHSSRCCQLLQEDSEGFFLQFLLFSIAPALWCSWRSGCQTLFKYTSLIPLGRSCGTTYSQRERKCRIQNLACHMQRPLGRQTKDSLYVFVFQQTEGHGMQQPLG